MKRCILIVLTIVAALIITNQLISSKVNNDGIKNEVTSTLNKNNNKITKLDQEFASRSELLNQEIKNNLIDSITLIDEKININDQNLNPKLYSRENYQIILSSVYLDSLQNQYQD